MELIKPSKKYKESFKEALQEFKDDGVGGFWLVGGDPLENMDDYFWRIEQYALGNELPTTREGWQWVPATTFWLIDENEFIGHINVRHKLVPELELKGGHIGYAIRPSKQGQGYGSKILELTLPETKKIRLKRALLTCDNDHIASKKIIEKNGGILQDQIDVNGKPCLRYWIEL
jgi:predicted acetyltransferase